MKKIFRILGIVILVGIFGGTIYFLYTKSKKTPDIYETKSPFVSNIVRKTVATGSVVPRKEIEIVPQVSGIIDELYIVAGDFVKKDQVIAKIKIIPDMVNLNNAENRLNRAKLNADEQQEIAGQLSQMFGVRSIPFCVMFAGGQPVDGFVGAIPEAQIRQFLDKHVPTADALPSVTQLGNEGVYQAWTALVHQHGGQALGHDHEALQRAPALQQLQDVGRARPGRSNSRSARPAWRRRGSGPARLGRPGARG